MAAIVLNTPRDTATRTTEGTARAETSTPPCDGRETRSTSAHVPSMAVTNPVSLSHSAQCTTRGCRSSATSTIAGGGRAARLRIASVLRRPRAYVSRITRERHTAEPSDVHRVRMMAAGVGFSREASADFTISASGPASHSTPLDATPMLSASATALGLDM